ncbi:uncharacterized protein [Epargyreus clarus]|uniref:uncharacterized protein n=1 Tax=Epargyreus clarus TaxID=520877 RepID=UPI003C2BC0AC
MLLECNDLYLLIPASVVNNVECYVIYDEHPRDKKDIDITICSKQGEVLEYYKKSLVSSTKIPYATDFRRISIVRSSNCDLYYLVEAREELIILSRKDNECPSILFPRLRFVKTYELCDLHCTGAVTLKVITENSTKYYSIDNGFKIIDEMNENTNSDGISSALRNKLKEAIDNLQSNKKAYKQILELRQRAAYFIPKPNDLKIEPPIVQFFNKKIVILLQVKETYNGSMENVCILIHNNSSNSISYSTKYFNVDEGTFNDSPFMIETEKLSIIGRSDTIVAAVIPLREFKHSVISKVQFNLVVSYQKQGKDYLQPCEPVFISASDVMGKNFDVFNSSIDNIKKAWTILSSTERTTLCLKQIIPRAQTSDNINIDPPKLFLDLLKFHTLCDFEDSKILVHKASPEHILHGMIIIFYDNKEAVVKKPDHFEYNFKIDVYTRCPTQVPALLHFIYDSISYTMIVTTPSIKVTTKSLMLDEEMDIS